MWNKFLFILFLLISISLPIFSQEQVDQENPVIVWEPIENAIKYQLQIKNEADEIILEVDMTETSYKLNLETGKYSHRVGSYNKFGKISSFSEWFPFVISRSLAPEVTSEKNITRSKQESQSKILIEGKNFYKDTKLTLKNEIDSVVITSVKLKKGIFEVTVDNENTKAGNYDLILENPRKKILVLNNFYQLKSEDIPFLPAVNSDTPYPYWKQAAKSTILPGSGQYSKDHVFSGIFFDVGLLLGAGYYKSSLDTFNSEKHKYNQLVLRSLVYQATEAQDIGIQYNFIANENQFRRAQAASTSTYQVSIFLASFYALNILDALLWKTSTDLSQSETNIHFYTKVLPAANSNFTPNHASTISQLEFGLRFNF
jgi:hypothetical protein